MSIHTRPKPVKPSDLAAEQAARAAEVARAQAAEAAASAAAASAAAAAATNATSLSTEASRAQVAESNRAIGLTAWHYGDSLSIDPPTAGVHGKSWMGLLQRQHALDKYTTFAVGGSDAIGIAYHVVNGSTGTFGLPAAVGGAKWDGTRRGLITLSCLINDASATRDRQGGNITESAIGPDAVSGLVGAFRAILAILSSASRIEESTATQTGTWTAGNPGAVFSGGAAKYSTTPGDHIDFANVPFPASGRIHLLSHAFDPAFAPPAAIEIKVDGVVVKTVSAATLTMRPQKTAASTTVNFSPCAVEITAAPGNHNVTLAHVGASGAMMSIDALIIPSTTPPPIIHLDEFNPPMPTGTATRLANLAVLRPAYAAVCAEFPNVKQAPITLDTAGFSTVDLLHPNERGAIEIEVEVSSALRSFLNTYNPDNLYTGLGAVTTPQLNQVTTTLAAWPNPSNGSMRVAQRSMFCFSGGVGVTAINVDGSNTGMVPPCAVMVKPGHSVSVTYATTPPNYCVLDAT